MSELKQDIAKVLNQESDKITQEKENKLREISNNFKRIMGLAQDHIAKGTPYKVNELDEQQTIEQFEKQSEEYEKIVKDGNTQKQSLRQEIAQMEIELRRIRDQVADKQIENKNLSFLIQKEEELKKQKNDYEKQALKTLSDDLEDQLSQLHNNAEKITGKVTPYGMEQVLQEKFQKTTNNYQQFLSESEKDLKDTQNDLDRVKIELEKERMITDSLQHEVNVNDQELQGLQETFQKHKTDLDEMNWQHDQKLKELEQIRIRANEEIKKLSVELGTAQSEINVLILESQKYESQLEFLATEREMILKAQLEAEDIDPFFQQADLQEAEAKRLKIEQEIMNLNREWFGKLEKVREETERVLTENEMKEFRSRIAILAAELSDKNQQIENINKDKQDMERLAEKAMSMGMQISEQTEEIGELNEKYKAALREKVDVYDELIESLKELVNRNSRFMKNEIEMCKLVNQTSVMKRELEQKEKYIEDMAKDINQRSVQDEDLQKKIKDRMEEKTQMLRSMRQEIRDRDQEIEFYEFLLREKQKKINNMQSSLIDQGKPQKTSQASRVNNQIKTTNVQAKDQNLDVLQGNRQRLEQQLVLIRDDDEEDYSQQQLQIDIDEESKAGDSDDLINRQKKFSTSHQRQI
ncbi:UNKNOWN [Stylonychia lemnae]|uniref:Uncharacterized protein n=1 Tax=Stylonychia lemnae TaxID=5949 RepID=A0A078A360_STYLE|nr:UNKNOWN [Stylonychia lemnae]|eukprot:CDW75938.1 UNKNOWN [Stylonychia lemnae]